VGEGVVPLTFELMLALDTEEAPGWARTLSPAVCFGSGAAESVFVGFMRAATERANHQRGGAVAPLHRVAQSETSGALRE
jgi:hypothetical protein